MFPSCLFPLSPSKRKLLFWILCLINSLKIILPHTYEFLNNIYSLALLGFLRLFLHSVIIVMTIENTHHTKYDHSQLGFWDSLWFVHFTAVHNSFVPSPPVDRYFVSIFLLLWTIHVCFYSPVPFRTWISVFLSPWARCHSICRGRQGWEEYRPGSRACCSGESVTSLSSSRLLPCGNEACIARASGFLKRN